MILRPGLTIPDNTSPSQAKSGQVRSGQDRTTQDNTGQDRQNQTGPGLELEQQQHWESNTIPYQTRVYHVCLIVWLVIP